jgi:Oxidoreductase molybdopterin binding domain
MTHPPIRRVSIRLLCVLALAVGTTHASVQSQERSSIVVSIPGKASMTLTIDDLKKLPVHAVEAVDVREAIKYEGAAVADVLAQAGLLFGQNMRGDRLKDFLVVESADRYRVVYALPEVDRQFTDATTIIAYQRNGKPMSDLDGAFRFVHSSDKRHARWVRKVVAITVQTAP